MQSVRVQAKTAGIFLSLLTVTAIGCGTPESATPLSSDTFAEATRRASAMAIEIPYDGTGHAVVSGEGVSPIDSRPYKYKIPKGYDATKPTPLVIMLHGLGASGDLNNLILGLLPYADTAGFLYAYPDGTVDPLGLRFWNATDFCCNFFGSTVDDVAYLTAVIDDMASHYNVDAKRVFFVGHSNGGFMAHRLACDRASKIAGIVSLAGAQWNDPTKCVPSENVSVLQVHGNADGIVAYNGGPLYPSAAETVDIWANRNHCTGRLTYSGENLDLDLLLLGAETKVESYTGCPDTGAVSLWTMQGGGHVPTFNAHWPVSIYNFLMAHPKP